MRKKEKDIWEAYSSTYDSYLEALSWEYVWRSMVSKAMLELHQLLSRIGSTSAINSRR